MEIITDKWREVPDFEGLYEVSIDGNIRSLDRWINNNGTATEFRKGRIMKPYINNYRNNYQQIILRKDNKNHCLKIHQIVARAFPEICGEWFDGCEIDHIDGNTQNNNAFNLKVTDKSGNMNNPLTIKKLRHYWAENGSGVTQYTKEGEFVAEYTNACEAARITGIRRANISAVCNHKYRCKTAGGFKWEFTVH